MSAEDVLRQLAVSKGFDLRSAGHEQLVAQVEALEALYRDHPAERTLRSLHRYLFPERYAPVALYQWHAGTTAQVAAIVEQALPDAPLAHPHSRHADASP